MRKRVELYLARGFDTKGECVGWRKHDTVTGFTVMESSD